jgi:uncharacterized protein
MKDLNDLKSLLNHPLITARYFFPQRAPFPLNHPLLVQGSQGTLHCWSSQIEPNDRPLLVHFHGNGELIHHWIQSWTPWIQAMGYEVLYVEYPEYGNSEGQAQLQAFCEDLPAVLQASQCMPEDIVVFGRSIGSLYAIEWVKRFPQTAGLVIESGIHDLLERILVRVTPRELSCEANDLIAAVDYFFNQGDKLKDYTGPSLFLHTVQDHLVSLSHAQANVKATAGRGKLHTFAWGDHNSIFSANQDEYQNCMETFLTKIQQ